MHSKQWLQRSSVMEAARTRPEAFGFIQLIRLFRHSVPELKVRHWSDHFHFISSLNLNFPGTEVESLVTEDDKWRMTSLMIGLTGIQGVLPYTYTSKIRQASRKQRQEVQAFLGLFNHTLTAQYVDATLIHNLPVRYELDEENHFLNILHALNGYTGQYHHQQHLDDYFAEFSGLMQGQQNSVHALSTILNSIFKLPVQIKEWIEEKIKLKQEHQTVLGDARHFQLGQNTFCGEYIHQMGGKIEIQMGPMDRAQYLEFLPGKKHSDRLKKIVNSWCEPTLVVDLRLILDRNAVCTLNLSSENKAGLAQGIFLMPLKKMENSETCYCLAGEDIR
ncbi:type VI secretion system baseplate subunit TssG [Acinetobacter chinensis]|uniref:Type VI secretion system baseplate subunit TssG n=1 Tax=Acinetobacter chinensis TaxID=2004650 RepID=A0ABU3WBK5_9GAMM|nr:type VI secretion system baseplate subunit TssG [Acinetobacter chinensis]MDV2467773.1 type VI secretion system baseplate subunit TssG [Acinetobacter chinensis]